MNLADLAKETVQLIQNEFPELDVGEKYGGTVFTPKGSKQLLGGVFVYKKHISIEFSLGYLLDDPDNKLQGSGKFRRHLIIHHQQEVDEALIYKFFTESMLLAAEA